MKHGDTFHQHEARTGWDFCIGIQPQLYVYPPLGRAFGGFYGEIMEFHMP